MEFPRFQALTSHKPEVRLSGGFATNGGSNPATLYGNWIQSVTRSGAGAYSVLLKPEFRGMRNVGKQASLQLAAVGDSKVVLGPYDSTAGTLVVTTVTGAAAADIAANADNIVWLDLTMIYSDVPNGSPNHDT